MLSDLIGLKKDQWDLIRLSYIQWHLISSNAYEYFLNVEGMN